LRGHRALPARCAAVEIVFVNVNPQSTLLLGQARGACVTALVVVRPVGGRIHRAADEEGRGRPWRAGKAEVQEMVKRLLKLPGVPGKDAADALGWRSRMRMWASMARLAQAAELSKTHAGTYRQGRTAGGRWSQAQTRSAISTAKKPNAASSVHFRTIQPEAPERACPVPA
jgi:hypothetical protein